MQVLARRATVRVLVPTVAVIALLSACTPLDTDEQQLFDSTNQLRVENRLGILYEHEPLTAKARAWAQTLAARGTLAHSDLQQLDVKWSAAAENVGRGSIIEDVVVELARSPRHRANMLNPAFALTGVGTARAKDGSIYVVQLFVKT